MYVLRSECLHCLRLVGYQFGWMFAESMLENMLLAGPGDEHILIVSSM